MYLQLLRNFAGSVKPPQVDAQDSLQSQSLLTAHSRCQGTGDWLLRQLQADARHDRRRSFLTGRTARQLQRSFGVWLSGSMGLLSCRFSCGI